MKGETMDAERRAALGTKGYAVVDDAADWLGLTDVERKVVELRIELGREVRRRREAAGLTQGKLAKLIGSSQSRIAKAEGTAGGVSLDLLVRAFFATGGEVASLGAVLSRSEG
jgi:hypothetical protein